MSTFTSRETNCKNSHRFSLSLELLQVARKLNEDLGGQVLRYDLVLTCVVIQLIKGCEEGSTEGVPSEK